MKFLLRIFVLLAVLSGSSFAATTQLTIYTDLEPDILNRHRRELAEKFPKYKIDWVRESGGPITARLLAELDNPHADLILGLSLSGVLAVDQAGGLDPYRPEGFDDVDPLMRDSRDNPAWVGMHVAAGALAVNYDELEKQGLPMPKSWADLTKPEYKDKLVFSNPISSGTAYFHVTSWIQNMGEEKAWQFMDDVHKNVKMYIHSGSKPAQVVAMGEAPVGLTVDAYIAPFIKKRAPVKAVYPKEGVGFDIVASAIVKGCRNPEAAKRILDYSISKDSALVCLEFDYLPVRPEFDDEKMAEIRSRLWPMDMTKAAEVRDQVLAEWRRRYGAE